MEGVRGESKAVASCSIMMYKNGGKIQRKGRESKAMQLYTSPL